MAERGRKEVKRIEMNGKGVRDSQGENIIETESMRKKRGRHRKKEVSKDGDRAGQTEKDILKDKKRDRYRQRKSKPDYCRDIESGRQRRR